MYISKPLEEGKQLDQVDFAKVVQAVTKTGHPVTVLLVPKFNEIEVLTGMNAPDDMLFDLSNAVDSLGYGRDSIIIAGDSSNLSRREYSDIRRVNGGAKDYFEEATTLCEMLRGQGVKVNPVPIGDGNILRKGWFIDADGTNRRTSHEYTEKQQEWFYIWMGQSCKVNQSVEGTNIGRACCGGRCTEGLVDNKWQEVKLVDNWFKNWYCSCSWY